LFVVPI